jgi:hypothetical protein
MSEVCDFCDEQAVGFVAYCEKHRHTTDAAPQLLEALKGCLDVFSEWENFNSQTRRQIDRARAAIALATGEKE